jgi:hypothetical protein
LNVRMAASATLFPSMTPSLTPKLYRHPAVEEQVPHENNDDSSSVPLVDCSAPTAAAVELTERDGDHPRPTPG